MRPTISSRQLADLAVWLTDRDWAILSDLANFRLLSGQQIRRLHFTGHASQPAAARAATGVLRQLASHHLIRALSRRIGGHSGGSDSYLWYLAPAGTRLLARHEQREWRTHPWISSEPGARFIQHTLAIAEVAVRLREETAAGNLDVLALQPEPGCWRDYLDAHGVRRLVKPDLFTITAAAGSAFEQLWFIELDLATESLTTIARKIAVYDAYQASGRAAAEHGTVPLVAWLAPDPARAHAIQEVARRRAEPFDIHRAMTLEEFIATVTGPDDPPGTGPRIGTGGGPASPT